MRARFVGIQDLVHPPAVAVAVVVDVMRAFTVAAWCFGRGAEAVVLAESLEDALELKRAHPGWFAIKDGAAAAGFDAVNSPAVVRALDLRGRTVVQKTTAGTVGALAVQDASLVVCASFAVAGATARFLRGGGHEDVTFVVTGEDGRAEEDLACAELIAALVVDDAADSSPALRRAAASGAAAELASGTRDGAHPDDVALCLELDRFRFAMVAALEDGQLVLRARR